MRADLRHLGNLRDAGDREENKGPLEIGTIVETSSENEFPEEVSEGTSGEKVTEGARKRIAVNAYERDRGARQRCIAEWGTRCFGFVCEFDFEHFYGGRRSGFIHVHHLRPIASIGTEYKLDPIRDLRPVCPNCHAMIHRFDPPLSIEDLQRVIADMRHGGG